MLLAIKRRVVQYLYLYPLILSHSRKNRVVLFGFCTTIGDNVITLSGIDDFLLMVQKDIVAIGPRQLVKLSAFYPQISSFIEIGTYSNQLLFEKRAFFLRRLQNKGLLVYAAHYLGHKNGLTAVLRMNQVFHLPPESRRITLPVVKKCSVLASEKGNEKFALVVPFSTGYRSELLTAQVVSRMKELFFAGYRIIINTDLILPSFSGYGMCVFWDLDTLYNAAREVDVIVGVRSGILDFLAGCGTPIEAYMLDDNYGHYLGTVFDLSMWGAICRNKYVKMDGTYFDG